MHEPAPAGSSTGHVELPTLHVIAYDTALTDGTYCRPWAIPAVGVIAARSSISPLTGLPFVPAWPSTWGEIEAVSGQGICRVDD